MTSEIVVAPPGPREAELLLLSGRLELGEEGRNRMRQLLESTLDWDGVLAWAGYHHITPLLHYHLNSMEEGLIPPDIQGELRTRYHGIAARSLRLNMELLSLVRELDGVGAPPVIWKGPALAHTLYPSPELRTYGDLDLILRREDRARARAVFTRRGYTVPPDSCQTEDQVFQADGNDATLWNPSTSIPLDIHWGSIQRHYSSVTDFQSLWAEHEVLELHGQFLRVLRSDTLLLALAVHGAKHGPFPWPALKWVTDMEAYLRGHPPSWWPPVLERARREGCLRMVLLGLSLAEELLDAPVPPPVAAALAKDAEVRKLMPGIRQRMTDPGEGHFPLRERIAFDLSVRERWKDRVAYRAARIFTPSARDADPQGTVSRRWLRTPLRLLRLGKTYLLRPSALRSLLQGERDESRGERRDG